jgi:hypothetical protein
LTIITELKYTCINGLALALRLGRYFSTTSEFRMNLQDYDLRSTTNTLRKQIERDVHPETPRKSTLNFCNLKTTTPVNTG